jgi:hypothetical protein
MLLIETEVKTSTIPNIGLGLFTKSKIQKGQIIWQLNAEKDCEFTDADIDLLPIILRDYIRRHSYKINNVYIFSNDNSIFMNHNSEPNVYQDFESGVEIADRDIEAGEELFCSYMGYDEDDIDRKAIQTNVFMVEKKLA